MKQGMWMQCKCNNICKRKFISGTDRAQPASSVGYLVTSLKILKHLSLSYLNNY